MTSLAFAWRDDIKIAVGVIVATASAIIAIGSALGYLKDWVRTGRDLIGRLRRRLRAWAADDVDPKDPTPEQLRVLNAVCVYFFQQGKPVTFRLLDELLDREGVPLRKNAESMPRGLLMPDVARRGGFFLPEDELMVTVEGLRHCEGGMSALDLLARVLAFMAEREKAFMPTSTQPDMVIRAGEVAKELGLSTLEIEQARFLINQFEPRAWTGATHGPDGDWSFTGCCINAVADR
jgi:hypothetical protein